MRNIKGFNKFINESHEIDYDKVDYMMKDAGFGDQLISMRQEEFEKSSYYKDPHTTEDYFNQFNSYMSDIADGKLED